MFETLYVVRVEYFQTDYNMEGILHCRRFKMAYSYNSGIYETKKQAEDAIKRFKKNDAKKDLRGRAGTDWNVNHFYRYNIDELTKFF